jgi:hypothetical protein
MEIRLVEIHTYINIYKGNSDLQLLSKELDSGD